MSRGNQLLNYSEGGEYLFCLVLVSLQCKAIDTRKPC